MAKAMQVIRARQRALTALLPHPGNQSVFIPSRRLERSVTVMTADLGFIDKTGFSSPLIATFGAMSPLDALGRDIAQVNHDVSDAQVEIIFAGAAGEILEDFWDSVTFASDDANWDGVTIKRVTNTLFDNTGATFTLWNFAIDVPFIIAETYTLIWRRE